MFTSILIISFVCIFCYIRNADGDGVCGRCGEESGVACLTSRTFVPCQYGIAQHANQTEICPNGTVCSDSSEICSNWTTTTADCTAEPSQCGTCSLDKRFACINATTFAYCFGAITPSTRIGMCAPGSFCDICAPTPEFCSHNANAICIPKQTTTTPVTNPPPTATEYCTQIKARDGLRYAAPYASNCKQFVYCFILNGMLRGNFYFCSGTTIFNNDTGNCVPPLNYICPAGQ